MREQKVITWMMILRYVVNVANGLTISSGMRLTDMAIIIVTMI